MDAAIFISKHVTPQFTCDIDRDDAGGDGVRVGVCFLIGRWKVLLGPVRLLRLG